MFAGTCGRTTCQVTAWYPALLDQRVHLHPMKVERHLIVLIAMAVAVAQGGGIPTGIGEKYGVWGDPWPKQHGRIT